MQATEARGPQGSRSARGVGAGSVSAMDPRTRRYVVLGALLLMVLVVALGALR
jgi:hypothetical protein